MKEYKFKINLIIFIFLPFFAFAHPHAFVDSIVTFQFDKDYLQGFWIEWTFDKLFSSEAIMYFDENHDGTFDKKEEQNVKEGASTLEQFGYFTYITYKGKTRMINKVKHFWASIKDHRLIYKFFIPLHIPKKNGKNKIEISIYDKVFYADFDYKDNNPVRFIGKGFEKCHYSLKRGKIRISYNNSDTSGGRPGKKYSGTAYPKEIVLFF